MYLYGVGIGTLGHMKVGQTELVTDDNVLTVRLHNDLAS